MVDFWVQSKKALPSTKPTTYRPNPWTTSPTQQHCPVHWVDFDQTSSRANSQSNELQSQSNHLKNNTLKEGVQ